MRLVTRERETTGSWLLKLRGERSTIPRCRAEARDGHGRVADTATPRCFSFVDPNKPAVAAMRSFAHVPDLC